MLVRAHDVTMNFSHLGGHAGFSQEVIVWGAGNSEGMFQSWMDSEGRRDTLMTSARNYYVCYKMWSQLDYHCLDR